MAGLRQIIVGVGLIVLFGIACIAFMTEFIGTNNPSSTALSNPYINSSFSALKEESSNLNTASSEVAETLSEDQPSPVSIFLIIPTAFTIPLSFLAMTITAIATIFKLPFVAIFGAGASDYYIVFDIIVAIIMVTVVFYIIRTVRTGDSG